MILTPSSTRDLLDRLGHQPKRFLGQNFLVDGNIVRKSVELAEVKTGDAVVEIGPGLGTLTSALLQTGAEVWAVEKDRTLHAHLNTTLIADYPTRLHLMEGDAIEHPLAGLNGERTAFKVVANLPYAISTPWMDAVLSGPLPLRMVLMLQQEAAQRYAAEPATKQFGAITVFLRAAYDLAPGHRVSSACFYPKPEIESVLLHLVRKAKPFVFAPQTKALIRSCFQQRRKQMGALLRERSTEGGSKWLQTLPMFGLDARARPEAIPPEAWIGLSL